VVGFVGSFFAYEGLELLLEAMLPLLRARDDMELLLVGEGESLPRLRARTPADLRDRVVLTGRIEHDQVPRYYSAMDVVAYPRLRSRLTELTTPLKPLEAMAMERVVVGSDVGGLRDLVQHNQTGFLVEPGKTRPLADCLAKLACDPAERRAVGRHAREVVLSTRDWAGVVQRYLPIYQSAVRQHGAPTGRLRAPTTAGFGSDR
jgi:glycosyltransferase involved in cell wall biosynthesis